MPPEVLEFLTRFSLFGIPAVGLVWVLVWMLKTFFKMDPKYVPWASLVCGFLVAGFMALVEYVPAAEPILMYITVGFLLSLSAMGAHSGLKALKGYLSVAPDSDAATVAKTPGTMIAPPGSTVLFPTGEVTDDPGVASALTQNTADTKDAVEAVEKEKADG